VAKLTVEQQRRLISDEGIRRSFMRRKDIRLLKPAERERLWKEHKIHLDTFRKQIAQLDAIVV
jgi:hypothetical protein